LAAIPVGESEVLALQGGRRLKVTRAEFFDRGFPRSFLLLEELTEELRASEKAAYGKLIRMMSHEINNSVGAVGSLLDSFRGYADQLGAEDRDDFLNATTVAINRLENLRVFMNGFAEVVRLPPPDRRPTDLGRLIDELLLLLRPELDRRRIRVEWDRSDLLPTIDLDRNQIEQVLVNILKNAAEAIGEDGAITVTLARRDGRPTLTIRDTGPGIPEDVRALLFTPFFSTKRNGRGLGLTLVQEILTAHGFDFSLGTAEGGGAELWVGF
jgi:two-component system nitrogen regulation sensor histidine kinase NtrY